MVKSEIIEKLKEKHPLLHFNRVSTIIDIILDTITQGIIDNKAIEIRSLGRFSVRTINAKPNARNPKTKELIFVPAKKKISFKMSKYLKDKINQII